MKPVITGAKGANPTTVNGTDGQIVLNGLTPGVSYNISYSKDGTPQTATATADDSGNAIISGVGAGVFGSFVVTDTTQADGEQTSDAFTDTVSLSNPAVEGSDGSAKVNTFTTSSEVLNNYFAGESNGKPDPREAVIDASEKFINDVKGLAKATGSIPATNNLLNLFIAQTVSDIEDVTTLFLEKLKGGQKD